MRERDTLRALGRIAQARAARVGMETLAVSEADITLRTRTREAEDEEARLADAYAAWARVLNAEAFDPGAIAAHHAQSRRCAISLETALQARDQASARREDCAQVLALARAHEAANAEAMRRLGRRVARVTDERRQSESELATGIRRQRQ